MLHYGMCHLFLLVTTVILVHARKDYYWRDYDGTIPEDALFAGRDFDGRDAYVGQVYLRGEGLIPVQINPGIRGIYAPLNTAKFSKENIKILCGKPDNLAWFQIKSSTIGSDLENKQPVIGGNEDEGGNYFIGRVYIENKICVGKVLEVDVETESKLHCVTKFGRLWKIDSYEVLLNLNGTDTI